MDRRDFLKCSGKACAGIGLGLMFNTFLQSCAGGLSVVKLNQESGWVNVPLSQVEQNSFLMIRVKDFPFEIGLQKKEEGGFLALVLMCPHANQPLTKAGSGYICTLHGSRFSKSGALLKGPSTAPLQELPVEQDAAYIKIRTGAFKA